MYRGIEQNYPQRTIHALYDIVCIKIAFVILIVPFLNECKISISCQAKKVNINT